MCIRGRAPPAVVSSFATAISNCYGSAMKQKRSRKQFAPRTFGSVGWVGAAAPVHSVLAFDLVLTKSPALHSPPGSIDRPTYQSWSFQVATNAAELTEPMLFYLPFLQRPDARPSAERQNVEHEAGLREITRLEMVGPFAGSLSPSLTAVVSAGLVRARRAKEYLAEVGFDGESLGRVADCRPALPLVLRW